MPKTDWRSILALLTAGLVLSTGTQLKTPSISGAVDTAAENIAEDFGDAGPHLGFDTFAYPGDDAMQAWLTADKPYRWVGYYLSAPCHTDDSWEGKRDTLANMGWGMAVISLASRHGAELPDRRSPLLDTW